MSQPLPGPGERAPLDAIAALLAGYERPWGICGGWAIDLAVGRQTRPHKDVDVALLRQDQMHMQTYLLERGWSLEKAVSGKLVPWPTGEWIDLPVHTIWCRHLTHRPDFVELLLNEVTATEFRFRRDSAIRRPRERMFRQYARGTPVLALEIVLLYKSKEPAQTDCQLDFEHALPILDREQAEWLADSLTHLYGEHPWLPSLHERLRHGAR